MAKKTKSKSPLLSRWRITWMDQWDQDFVDQETEGYFEFGPNDSGSFQFGYVEGPSTTAPTFVTPNRVLSSHGTATTRWTLFKGEAGPYLTGMKSRG